MRYRNILLLVSGLLVVYSCHQGSDDAEITPDEGVSRKPNILWISCEDMSPRLGCYGDPIAQTPNIDQLALEGCRYTRVFTTSPVCAPCRAGIITGMYPTTIGAHHMRTSHVSSGLPTPYEVVPPAYLKTFTEYLRANGYYCTNNSKTDYQIGEPFTAWDESGPDAHYSHRPDSSQPFFSVFNLFITHEKNTWNQPKKTDPAKVELPPYYPDIPEARNALAVHYDNIAVMDSLAGELIRDLKMRGLYENTIIFFWSDHGDGLPRAKRWLYDAGTHVPVIVRIPGAQKVSATDDRLISSIDLGPTVLSLAGIPIPVHMQGLPFAGNIKAETRQYVFSARDRFDESYDRVRSVRDEQFLYIRNYYPQRPYIQYIPYRDNSPLMQKMLEMHVRGTLTGIPLQWFASSRPAEELYDCTVDPYNVVNLATNQLYGGKLQEMREQLDSWMKETDDLGEMDEAEMIAHMWPQGKQPETSPPSLVVNAPVYPLQMVKDTLIKLPAPAEFYLYCPTQGASMGYRFASENATWKLYSGPVSLETGDYYLKAKAVRYGFLESPETEIHIQVTPP